MKWISVKDRMPENNERVLAYGIDKRVHDAVWDWPDNSWHCKTGHAVYLESFVTHWMPLPQLPWGDCKHSYEDLGESVCNFGPCSECEVEEDFWCKYRERGDDGA